MSCCNGGQLVLSSVPLREPLQLVPTDDYVRALTFAVDEVSAPQSWPAGQYFMELATTPTKTVWQWHVSGLYLSVKVESEETAKIPDRTEYALKFLPSGELSGGQSLIIGKVKWVVR